MAVVTEVGVEVADAVVCFHSCAEALASMTKHAAVISVCLIQRSSTTRHGKQ